MMQSVQIPFSPSDLAQCTSRLGAPRKPGFWRSTLPRRH